jgi:hypothetical protein
MCFIQEKFKFMFRCARINLWIKEGMSGIYYTTKAGDPTQQARALQHQGIFGEISKNKKPINKRDRGDETIVLYYFADQGEENSGK